MNHIDLGMTLMAQSGKSLDWFADEPDLYTDADLNDQAQPATP